jgi:hypothetical protein
MTIKINLAVYFAITLLFAVWFLSDFFKSWNGGNFTPGKATWEVGFSGILSIVLWVIFSLIWGGIFWW